MRNDDWWDLICGVITLLLVAAMLASGGYFLVRIGLEFGWWGALLVFASTPIGMISLGWLAIWAIIGPIGVVLRLINGTPLWEGRRQLAAWSADFSAAREAGVPDDDWPRLDDYCLRKRVWRRHRS